jgi:hypothetical protein
MCFVAWWVREVDRERSCQSRIDALVVGGVGAPGGRGGGWTVLPAVEHDGVMPDTARRWVGRFREQGTQGLQ